MKHVELSQSSTLATQNDITACFETFNGEVLQLLLDTARPQENQRLATRHVGAPKRACRARFPYISHFAASKSTFSYEFSYDSTSKSRFGARLPPIFITCHKMPRLPRNLPQHDTSKLLRLPRKMTSAGNKCTFVFAEVS